MNVPFFDLKRQFQAIGSEIRAAMEQVFESQQFILGVEVDRFEQRLAEFCGVGYAVGCASGTDALLLSLQAIGIGENTEVITPAFSFAASATCITRVGAQVVFCDIEPRTLNIDPEKITDLITDRTAAIITVHLFGQCADMEKVCKIAADNKLHIIEDAAQALGARLGVRLAGAFGDAGCFSFYPTKNLGTFGDAGAVVTDRPEIAENLRLLRNHGETHRYEYSILGINSRLDAMQAAILNVKINYLEKFIKRRIEIAEFYNERFADLPIILPIAVSGRLHTYHQYTIRMKGRDRLQQYLTENSIGTRVYYPKPLHLQPCFSYLGYREGAFSESEKAAATVISLPIFPELTDSEIEYVASTVRKFFTR